MSTQVGYNCSTLITTQHQLGPMQFSQAEHKSNKVFRHALQSGPITDYQTEQVTLRHTHYFLHKQNALL